MTENEFYDWLEGVHCSRFPNVNPYFAKLPDQREGKRAWFMALGKFQPSVLAIASQKMLEDEKASQAWPDKHPALLRAFAKEVAYERNERFHDGKWVEGPEGRVWAFHCGYCRDTGFVEVWLPAAVKCLGDQSLRKFNEWESGHWRPELVTKDGKEEIVATAEWCYHKLTIRCCCERGSAFGLSWCKHQFNPQKHWRVFTVEGTEGFLESLEQRERFLPAPAPRVCRDVAIDFADMV